MIGLVSELVVVARDSEVVSSYCSVSQCSLDWGWFFFFIISFIKGGAPAFARERESARGGPDVLAHVGLPLADRVLSAMGCPTGPPTVLYRPGVRLHDGAEWLDDWKGRVENPRRRSAPSHGRVGSPGGCAWRSAG